MDVNNRFVCYDIRELGKQLKKLGMLKNGCAHFVKAVVFGYLAHCRFDILGFIAVLGQQIESTLYGACYK